MFTFISCVILASSRAFFKRFYVSFQNQNICNQNIAERRSHFLLAVIIFLVVNDYPPNRAIITHCAGDHHRQGM